MVGGKLILFVLAATASSACAKRQVKGESYRVDRESTVHRMAPPGGHGDPDDYPDDYPEDYPHRPHHGHYPRHGGPEDPDDYPEYPEDYPHGGHGRYGRDGPYGRYGPGREKKEPPPACGTKNFKVMMVGPWGSRRPGKTLSDMYTKKEEHFNEFRPSKDCVVVDSMAFHWVIDKNDVDAAEGSSKSLYRTVGILEAWAGGDDEGDGWNGFPDEVRSSLKSTGDAKYYAYAKDKYKLRYDTNIIHVFAPDLRRYHDQKEAEDILAKSYNHILREFLASGKKDLRMLPLSDGIWSGEVGPHEKKISEMTITALTKAVEQLDTAHKEQLKGTTVHMCIYMEGLIDEYLNEAKKKCPDVKPR